MMHAKWKRFIDTVLTPQYYKSIYAREVERMDNNDTSVKYIIQTLDYHNTHHPYKPVVEKRTISEVNSAPTGNPQKKPVAEIDVHDKVKPQGSSKGTNKTKSLENHISVHVKDTVQTPTLTQSAD